QLRPRHGVPDGLLRDPRPDTEGPRRGWPDGNVAPPPRRVRRVKAAAYQLLGRRRRPEPQATGDRSGCSLATRNKGIRPDEQMWYPGRPAAEQCEGCTLYTGQVRELSFLHSRAVTYATFCQGPYDESVRYRDFMGWEVPWYSVQDSAEALLAGRQVNHFYLV